MLTLITTAKQFEGHSGVIQRNALQSWKRLDPNVEVILFGDEKGAAEVCADYGLRHEAHVDRHESGMKYVDYIFKRAQEIARHDYLCYSNCDIILLDDFWKAFEKARGWRKRFLLVGRRWDTDVSGPIDFTRPSWAEDLRQFALTTGALQLPGFIDYFVFPKRLYDYVPPLVVGRSYWDHWLIWKALSSGAPVIDCSQFVVQVHQNHDYGYHPGGKKGTDRDALALRNKSLSGNGRHLRSIQDSTHRMTSEGDIRRNVWRRLIRSTPFGRLEYGRAILRMREQYQRLINKTFWIRNRIGLRRSALHKLLGR